MRSSLPVDLLLEGHLEEAVAHRILGEAGLRAGVSFGRNGIDYLLAKAPGFVKAAVATPLLVLADFRDLRSRDVRFDCPPAAVRGLIPDVRPPAHVVVRLAVPELESWLLADRAGLARFLGVQIERLPIRPEELPGGKQEIISLARRSRYPRIRRLLPPAAGTSAPQGEGYVAELSLFVRDRWDLQAASSVSPSLARCRHALDRLR